MLARLEALRDLIGWLSPVARIFVYMLFVLCATSLLPINSISHSIWQVLGSGHSRIVLKYTSPRRHSALRGLTSMVSFPNRRLVLMLVSLLNLVRWSVLVRLANCGVVKFELAWFTVAHAFVKSLAVYVFLRWCRLLLVWHVTDATLVFFGLLELLKLIIDSFVVNVTAGVGCGTWCEEVGASLVLLARYVRLHCTLLDDSKANVISGGWIHDLLRCSVLNSAWHHTSRLILFVDHIFNDLLVRARVLRNVGMLTVFDLCWKPELSAFLCFHMLRPAEVSEMIVL